MQYSTFKSKIAEEIERQKKVESMDTTEKILLKVMEEIERQNIYCEDVKHMYFYICSNNYFCSSFSVGFSYTTSAFEHSAVMEGVSTAYLHPIAKYGECSRDVVASMLNMLKERLESEGMNIVPYLDSGFCCEIF